jgi:hypothetical protein
MTRVVVCLAVLAAAALHAGASPVAVPQEPLTVERLLQTVGSYIAGYERAYAAIVSKETYVQRTFMAGQQQTRTLESEVALVAAGDAGWVIFRDVFAVDGKPIRDRRDRLTALLGSAEVDVRSPAQRIAEESARYNLGPIARTINIPTAPLLFLRLEHQARSSFRLGGRRTIEGLATRELQFDEQARPRLIVTRDDAAASGRIWVDPAKGTVVRTEFRLKSDGASASVDVTYTFEPKVALWLPAQMREHYELPAVHTPRTDHPRYREFRPAPVSISGDAAYTDFRQFSVKGRMVR